MRHTHSLIVAAIAPLAVIGFTPTTTTESIPGSSQSQVSGAQGDMLAARPRAKNTTRRDLQRRSKLIRPRTNRQDPTPADPPSGET